MGIKKDKGALPRISAKAEATAHVGAVAKIERKKTITEIIPEDVTRAKASAWLTLISPITHWAGLKGDQLAFKRDLLRIQQDETLDRIARRTLARLANSKSVPEPVPPKFLIPFLEKASLEDPDSDLIGLWANLLASAAIQYNPHFVHFSNIISQLSSKQGELFERLIGKHGRTRALIDLEKLGFHFETDFLKEFLLRQFNSKRPKVKSASDVFDFIASNLNLNGICVVHLDVGSRDFSSDDYVGGLIGGNSSMTTSMMRQIC
jgi:hypothetical protein